VRGGLAKSAFEGAEFRIPTLLTRVDQLARGIATPR
jgi:hypothetical protein